MADRSASTSSESRLLTFLTIPDERGTLVVAEDERHIPFRISSARWSRWDGGWLEGGALDLGVDLQESVVVALTGRLDVVVDNGPGGQDTVCLDRPDVGLHVPAGSAWTIGNPSSGAVSLQVTGGAPASAVELGSPPALPGWFVTTMTSARDVPFRTRRIYYLHSVPSGAVRGGHAHHELQQVVVAVSGSFDLVLHDGRERATVRLERPDVGVYIPRGVWRELKAFSAGAVCLVLASLPYDDADYTWDFEHFLRQVGPDRSH